MKRNIPLYYFFTAMRAGLFFVPIWISYQSHFLNLTQIAFFASLQLTATLILELPTRVLADLIGKKYTLFIGTLINGISYLLLGLFPTPNTMIIYALLNGLGISFISGANSALLYDTLIDLDKKRISQIRLQLKFCLSNYRHTHHSLGRISLQHSPSSPLLHQISYTISCPPRTIINARTNH